MSIHQSDALTMLAEVSTSPVSINSEESTIDQDIIDTAINDVVLVTETTVSSLEDIANGNVSDMELSEHEINLVSTRKSASLKTRLVSIKGIRTENITIAVLRRFSTHIGMTTRRSGSKYDIVQALVTFALNPVSNEKGTDKDDSAKLVVNRRRFLNVLFCDDIRPHLPIRVRLLIKMS